MKFKVYYDDGGIDEYSDERFVASRLFPGEADICTIFQLQPKRENDGIWVKIDYYNINELLVVDGHSDRIPKIATGYEIQIVDASDLEHVVRVTADDKTIWMRLSETETVDVTKFTAQAALILGTDLGDEIYRTAARVWHEANDDASLQDADEARKYVELAGKLGMSPETLRDAVEWADRQADEQEEELAGELDTAAARVSPQEAADSVNRAADAIEAQRERLAAERAEAEDAGAAAGAADADGPEGADVGFADMQLDVPDFGDDDYEEPPL